MQPGVSPSVISGQMSDQNKILGGDFQKHKWVSFHDKCNGHIEADDGGNSDKPGAL